MSDYISKQSLLDHLNTAANDLYERGGIVPSGILVILRDDIESGTFDTKSERLLEENERLKREIASHGPDGRNHTNLEYVTLRTEHAAMKESLVKVKEMIPTLLDEQESPSARHNMGNYMMHTIDQAIGTED